MKEDRYKNIPISDQTRKGMTLNVNDLAAIGRLLSLQDNVYDEQFEEINKALKVINRNISSMKREFAKLCDALTETQEELDELKAS